MKIDQRLKFSSLTGNSGKIKRATGRPKSKPFSKGVHIDQNAVSTYKRTSGNWHMLLANWREISWHRPRQRREGGLLRPL